MDDFKSWYISQPIVTRTFLSICIITSVLVQYNLVNYKYLSVDKFIDRPLQVWRLLTNLFLAGGLSINLLFELYFAYLGINNVEKLFPKDRLADVLWLQAFVICVVDVLGIIVGEAFLFKAFVYANIYIWCKRKPMEQVRFYFGFIIKNTYFPYFLIGFHILSAQSILPDLIGLAAGHSYIFLKDILPVSHRKDYLATPRFFTKLVDTYILRPPPRVQGMGGGNFNAPQPAQNQGFRQFGGQGVRLG